MDPAESLNAMIERLAIPAWNTPATPLDAWLSAMGEHGHEARLVRDSGMTWIDVPSLRMRGCVVFESDTIEAIHFEIHHRDPQAALNFLDTVAPSLRWEIHDETDEDDEP